MIITHLLLKMYLCPISFIKVVAMYEQVVNEIG